MGQSPRGALSLGDKTKATLTSFAVALVQSFIVAYSTFVPQPDSWDDLVKFKFVMLLVISTAGNLGLAHTNFRSADKKTREADPEQVLKVIRAGEQAVEKAQEDAKK